MLKNGKRKSWLGALLVVAVAALAAAAQGSARPAKPAPIKVGFLNQEKGAISFPDFGVGARAARAYIDARLGGINGRPLEFVECLTDGSPETSIDCANKFVQAHVVAVLEGIDFGSDATLPILKAAHVPLVGHTAFGAGQSVAHTAFFFGAATGAYDVVPLVVARNSLHASSIAYLAEDNAVDRAYVDNDMTPAAKALGLKLTTVFYQAPNPDYTSTLETALAAHPDALFTTAPEPDCVSFVQAVATLGYHGPAFAGSCSLFIHSAASAANGVFTSSDLYLPDRPTAAPPAKARELQTYLQQMKIHAPAYVSSSFAQDTFSSTMDLAAVLRRIRGPVTAVSVLRALNTTRNLSSFMGQSLSCNRHQWPDEPAACANGLIEYRVENGVRVPFTHGFVHAADLFASR